MDMYDEARRFAEVGIVALPAGKGKRPAVATWKEYQTRPPTEKEQRLFWAENSPYGIGLVTGAVSGGLIMVEFEGRAVADKYPEQAAELAEASGLAELWTRLLDGFVVASPSGGQHHYCFVKGDVPGNTKLARRKVNGQVEVLIETRGEGGWVVTAPTSGRWHPSGEPWRVLRGTPNTIPTLSADEHDALMALLHALDEMPATEAAPAENGREHGDDLRPGDDFNQTADWTEILVPHGWALLFQHGRTRYWRRPGKQDGISATTGRADDADRLYVFTSSTELPTETPISKFAAHTYLNFGGDFAAATRDLRAKGFGAPASPPPALRLLTNDTPLPYDDGSALAREQHPSVVELPALPPSLSDDGNARLLIVKYGAKLRYASGLGWLVWRGPAWSADERDEVIEMAKDTIHGIQAIDEKIAKHQSRSLGWNNIQAMIAAARSLRRVRVNPSELDQNPTILNHPEEQ